MGLKKLWVHKLNGQKELGNEKFLAQLFWLVQQINLSNMMIIESGKAEIFTNFVRGTIVTRINIALIKRKRLKMDKSNLA